MKKIKKFAKNLFSANRMKMLAMMLLCGTAVTFAQNAAGDYTAGTNALSTVTEEIAKYVPYVVKLCYAIAGVVAVVGAISVYIAMNNEEQDVCLSSSVSKPDSSVDTHYGSRNRTQRICQLPNVQGTSEASGVHGHPRALHHMGSLRCWRCHSWLHHCLLHLWICCWSDCSCCFSLHWCRTYLLQTEERSAHKERRPRCVYLRLFTKNVIFIECS